MTTSTRTGSLDALLRPASVAVIGASNDPTRIGGRPIRYLREAGFSGQVHPVNPKHDQVQGLPAFPHISAVPEGVDLAIVAVPAAAVVDTVAACAARGVRVAVIYSAGFAEMGAEGRRHQRRLADIAAETGLRIVGPNCLGVYNSELGFFATFSTTLEDGFPAPGSVALVSQSGAYGSHLSLLARKRNIDIRYWVTTGNEADVSVPEVLGWLAEQDDVSVIMAHAEGITDRDALVRALETARARRKPVVFQKVGVTEVGAQAAQSHTASLAGADPVYEAAFRQFGAYRARDTDEMLDVAYAASFGVFPESRACRAGLHLRRRGRADGGRGGRLRPRRGAAERGGAGPAEGGAALRLAAQPGRHHRAGVQPRRAHRGQPRESSSTTIEHDAVVAFFTYVAAADGMIEPIRQAIHDARSNGGRAAFSCSRSSRRRRSCASYEEAGCPVFEDPTRAVRVRGGAPPFQPDLRGRRATPTPPTARTPHARTPPLPAKAGTHAQGDAADARRRRRDCRARPDLRLLRRRRRPKRPCPRVLTRSGKRNACLRTRGIPVVAEELAPQRRTKPRV